MADKIRIGIIDVYPIFRAGVVQAIARSDTLTVVATGGTADEARRLAWRCDVLVLEPAVPGSLGLAKDLLENTRTKVVFLSARVDDEHAMQRESGRTRIDIPNPGQEQCRQELAVRNAPPELFDRHLGALPARGAFDQIN